MDENARARAKDIEDVEEQSAGTSQLWELSYRRSREDAPDPPRGSYGLAQGELDFLHSHVSGHRWNAWRRLTGDEDYYAACSCGWRSTETSYLSPVLHQVKGHLAAVRAVRGWYPSTPRTQPSARDEGDASQRERQPDERARELYASVERQQRRLSQALEHSSDLLSASEDQADRFVTALERAAAGVVPQWAMTRTSAERAEALQRRAERVKDLRSRIIATTAALAAIAQEVALVNQDPETRPQGGTAKH
jgi:hypothetical protein